MKNLKQNDHKNIDRKEALIKLGKYAALTSLGTFLILNPLHSQIGSIPIDPGPFD